ncbi:MAG: hypothetical protein KGN84_05680 [Acidobacteriota bacterium]|nr:hypothetical protein [Acidobacteriota bacterium]
MSVLTILMRVLHIVSAITILGGVLAWRYALIPSAEPLAPETKSKVGEAVAAAWRPWVLAASVGIVVSGIFNFLHKTGLTPEYHAIFGIKILLALHVLAVVLIATRPGNERRARQLSGIAVSGALIVILSAVLRWLSTR